MELIQCNKGTNKDDTRDAYLIASIVFAVPLGALLLSRQRYKDMKM
jgi:hypothetical protein